LIAETGGTPGLRDEALLESALTAARNRHHYETADVVSCAATYAFHLTQTHAFLDGNKRVAAAITEAFLETNGFELIMSNEEIVSLFLAIASDTLTREQTEQLLRTRVRPKNLTMKTPEEMFSPKLAPKVLEFLAEENRLRAMMRPFSPMSIKERKTVEMRRDGYSLREIAAALDEDLKTTRLRWRNMIMNQRKRK
jgi:death-on-curing protein